jgi:hypothetical protein
MVERIGTFCAAMILLTILACIETCNEQPEVQ